MKIKIFIILILAIFIIPIISIATTASSSKIYNGIDVSNWQGYIDYKQVKKAGIEIVYIKASQGSNIIDPYFKINYNNAKSNGLKVGFYHYLTARSKAEAKKQAEFFASVISATKPDCKLAMDFEIFGNLNNEEINIISRTFLERVKEITKKDVIIYSNASSAKNTFNKKLAKDYHLWIAEYGVKNPRSTNWTVWEGYQYTNQGRISGIKGYVDRDKYTSDILLKTKTTIVPNGKLEVYKKDMKYTVKKGDTLSKIANKYKTTVNELADLNKIKNPNLIFVGQSLLVPIEDNNKSNICYDTNHIIYTVKNGDSLSKLAKKFKTTVKSIAKLNDIKNVNLIFVGQKLRINR